MMGFFNAGRKNNEGIKTIYGRKPLPEEKEFKEFMNYESCGGDIEVAKLPGPFSEPWLNAVNAYEPASMPAFQRIIKIPHLADRIRGSILDVGAGTCWLTAKVSSLPYVEKVFALDLSERFLHSTGERVLRYFNSELPKITFVVSDFNEIPVESGTIDCALLFGSIHHSLSPIKTLQEVGRCLKKGGVIMILENPPASIKIWGARKRSFELNKNVTEIVYTMRELEYLIKISGVGQLERYTLDILSRGGVKMIARKILRKLGVEDLLINPPTYLFVVVKN